MLIKKSLTLKTVYFLTCCIGFLYVITGILKIIEPEQIIKTFDLLINMLYGINFSLKINLALIYLLAFWEVLVGASVLFRVKYDITLEAAFITNIVFTIVSHYLYHLDKLSSCGCFGVFSASLYPIHFLILYLCNVILLLAIIIHSKRLRQKIRLIFSF